jgi:hypothetical protein
MLVGAGFKPALSRHTQVVRPARRIICNVVANAIDLLSHDERRRRIAIYGQSHGSFLLRQGGFETRPYLRIVCCMSSSEDKSADTLPRVNAVHAARAPWTLNVTWADGTKDRVNLTGLVHRSRHFRTFLDRPADFRKVSVADFGGGVEWENGLDYGADTLKRVRSS